MTIKKFVISALFLSTTAGSAFANGNPYEVPRSYSKTVQKLAYAKRALATGAYGVKGHGGVVADVMTRDNPGWLVKDYSRGFNESVAEITKGAEEYEAASAVLAQAPQHVKEAAWKAVDAESALLMNPNDPALKAVAHAAWHELMQQHPYSRAARQIIKARAEVAEGEQILKEIPDDAAKMAIEGDPAMIKQYAKLVSKAHDVTTRGTNSYEKATDVFRVAPQEVVGAIWKAVNAETRAQAEPRTFQKDDEARTAWQSLHYEIKNHEQPE